MKIITLLSLLIALAFSACQTQQAKVVYESESVKIEKLTKNTFRHISYLSTNDFGKVSCNGMIVIDNGEALIIDTPTNDSDSKELIDWIKNRLNCKTIGVVATHFHRDCLGGLKEFHKQLIPSYASFQTIDLAKRDSLTAPQIGFENYLEIKVGDKKVLNEFLGEGHTTDNIVSYFPDEKVLFGGCLIKSMKANKGYLGDANSKEWSKTVGLVKNKFAKAEIIIPGHGEPGNQELLNYTIELFREK